MAEVHVTKQVAVAPDELWRKIGDFHGIDRWMPNAQPTEAVNDGKARRFDLGTTALVEELVEEGNAWYTYRITEAGPLPVENYEATLKVSSSGNGSVVTWDAKFDPRGVDESQAVAIITGIFENGLSGL